MTIKMTDAQILRSVVLNVYEAFEEMLESKIIVRYKVNDARIENGEFVVETLYEPVMSISKIDIDMRIELATNLNP